MENGLVIGCTALLLFLLAEKLIKEFIKVISVYHFRSYYTDKFTRTRIMYVLLNIFVYIKYILEQS